MDSDEPIIHLRPSQIKIKFPADFALEDPAHLTIDVLRASHMKCGVKLSREMVRSASIRCVPCSDDCSLPISRRIKSLAE